MTALRRLVAEGLASLGVERFVLAIHDVSFPSDPDEDTGRGSPYTKGAEAFFEFAAELGFDGIQLGPQGQTSLSNRSPYDGSVFAKSVLSVPLRGLIEEKLLHREVVDWWLASRPSNDRRAHDDFAHSVMTAALRLSERELSLLRARGGALAKGLDAWANETAWLTHDVRFEVLAARYGTDDFRAWAPLDRRPSAARISAFDDTGPIADAFRLAQWLLTREHANLRERLAGSRLRLYGDLQVGISLRDRWAREDLFLSNYALGAPPSRTNPEGQPWGYAVLDPRRYQPRFVGANGDDAAIRFFRDRVAKVFDEFDGIRLDHPHGIVCPWVYERSASDPLAAVARGARLFETPGGVEKDSDLAALSIVRPDQIDPNVPAYADERIHSLEPAQIEQYACLVDIVLACARSAGRDARDVLCEVLSTCPAPLAAVLMRYGLGRFRVTQKASLTDASDGYRGENADPSDWTMIGNHDTDPLRLVLERWRQRGTLAARAAYLATRLEPDPDQRRGFAAWALERDAHMATAMFAELFVGPAANVLVFWADLLGEREIYNMPGVVSADNWTMRVPRAFRALYTDRVGRGEAIDVPSAVALALRARRQNPELTRALRARAAIAYPAR